MLLGHPLNLKPERRKRLDSRSLRLSDEAIAGVRQDRGRVVGLATWGGLAIKFYSIDSLLGDKVLLGLATALGASVGARNCQSVNPHQKTSVVNLYAAADLLVELDQISVSIGQAAIEAAAIHNLLPGAA